MFSTSMFLFASYSLSTFLSVSLLLLIVIVYSCIRNFLTHIFSVVRLAVFPTFISVIYPIFSMLSSFLTSILSLENMFSKP